MIKKILVIGGTGDIGKAISKKFTSKDIHSVGSKDLDLSCNNSMYEFFECIRS